MFRQQLCLRWPFEVFCRSVNRRPAILWQVCSKQIRCPSRIAIAEERAGERRFYRDLPMVRGKIVSSQRARRLLHCQLLLSGDFTF